MNPLNQTRLPISHSETCTISESLVLKQFKTVAIYYCPECFAYHYDYDFCVHDYIPVRFITANGSTQIRNYCKKCLRLNDRALKHTDYFGANLPEKNLIDYKNYYEGECDKEKPEIVEFINEIKKKAHDFNQNVYAGYLTSPHWKELKEKVAKRDEYTCQICGKPYDHVHHLTYHNRGREYPFELVSLCKKCHITIYHPERYYEIINQTNTL